MTRLVKGLSQQNMADELGITVASYSNIERGVTELTVSRLSSISKILDVTLFSLIEEEKSDESLIENQLHFGYQSTMSIQLLEIIQKLNKQQKEIERLKIEMKILQK